MSLELALSPLANLLHFIQKKIVELVTQVCDLPLSPVYLNSFCGITPNLATGVGERCPLLQKSVDVDRTVRCVEWFSWQIFGDSCSGMIVFLSFLSTVTKR